VNVWAVLQVVIANVSISRLARHDLQQYLNLMTRIEALAGREISEADEQDKNAKSVRLPGRYGSRRVQGVATPFLMSHHSTKIMHGRTRRWLRSGQRIIVLLRSTPQQDAIPSLTRREPS
jgi:hypothetical protein